MAVVAESISDRTSPVCSVCIANYNGMEYLDRCIQSVQDQDFPLPLEIIIHDDASTDGSADYIRKHYPHVVLIDSTSNVGFCVGNNRMVARARGAYILLLNNDAELFPDALRTLYAEAVTHKEGAILGLPQYEASSGSLLDFGLLLDPFLNPLPNLDPSRREVGMVIGACLWLPKTLWEELGGFPEWFHTLAEDMYLCSLARLRGRPVKGLSRSGFRHWVGRNLGGGKVVKNRLVTTRRRRAWSERNKSFVMIITYPFPIFPIVFAVHVIMLLCEGLLLATGKRDGELLRTVYLSTFTALWKRRHALFLQRRKIQGMKKVSCSRFFSAFTLIPHKLSMLIRHGIPKIL